MTLTRQQSDDFDEVLVWLQEALEVWPNNLLIMDAPKNKLISLIAEISEALEDATIEEDPYED